MNHIAHEKYVIPEKLWLLKYGMLFPLLGIPAGFIVEGALWAAITLDANYMPTTFSGWITWKGFVFGAVFSMVPLVWMISIWLERKCGEVLRRYAVVPMLVVAAFLLFEFVFRQHMIQDMLWQSVRARSGSDYFAREVSLLRLDESYRRTLPESAPGVVVSGSSQMLHALDVEQLGKLSGLPVYRRATAGMFPAEMSAASGLMDFNPSNMLLLMISGFDLGGRDDLYTDAIRPLATPAGVRGLWNAATFRFALGYWRSFADLNAAALCDTWRSRDYIRMIFNHPFQPVGSDVATDDEATREQRAAYVRLGQNQEMLEFSQAALREFLTRMSTRFKQIVVIEGQVNPEYPGREMRELSAAGRSLMIELMELDIIKFIPLADQHEVFGDEDWLDMAHVNESGRQKYTRIFARALQLQHVDPRHE